MNDRSDETFDPRIADWLADGPDRAPAVVLQKLAAALPSISQRSSWRSPWRFPALLRFASASVMAGLLAIAAVAVFNRPPDRPGNPTPPPAQSPSTTTPVPSPSATTMAYPALTTSDVRRSLPTGGYRVEQPFAAPFTVRLPDTFKLNTLEQNAVELRHVGSAYPSSIESLSILIVDQVFPDPCHTDGGPLAIGSDADALVDGLTSMAGFWASPITEVSINGVSGRTFLLEGDIDTEAAGCSGGPMLWVATYRQDGNSTNVGTRSHQFMGVWVLDVHGTPVLVVVGGRLGLNYAAAARLVATLVFDEPPTATSDDASGIR